MFVPPAMQKFLTFRVIRQIGQRQGPRFGRGGRVVGSANVTEETVVGVGKFDAGKGLVRRAHTGCDRVYGVGWNEVILAAPAKEHGGLHVFQTVKQVHFVERVRGDAASVVGNAAS